MQTDIQLHHLHTAHWSWESVENEAPQRILWTKFMRKRTREKEKEPDILCVLTQGISGSFSQYLLLADGVHESSSPLRLDLLQCWRGSCWQSVGSAWTKQGLIRQCVLLRVYLHDTPHLGIMTICTIHQRARYIVASYTGPAEIRNGSRRGDETWYIATLPRIVCYFAATLKSLK